MKISDNGFPRRNRVDLNTPAELAIRNAIRAVEETGCDPLLTIRLAQAYPFRGRSSKP